LSRLPGKRAWPVLREPGRSNASRLPDYWAADVLAEHGAQVHLAHPLGVKGFAYRRVKNDERDAADLADLLRMGRLPEVWIAPPATRELRELVRHRAKLVALRSGLKAGVHSVLANSGVHVPVSDLFGVAGQWLLDGLSLPAEYLARIMSLRHLIDAFTFEIDLFAGMVRSKLATNAGYAAVQALEGVGPILAAIFVAEIGDVHRFASSAQLCSWAGLTPLHRESDTKVHRGRITKQGSTLVRWAAVEAVQRLRRGPVAAAKARIIQRRGTGIGKVAAARKRSPWSSTAYATDTSVAWQNNQPRNQREHRPDAARTRGRALSDPHRAVAWPT